MSEQQQSLTDEESVIAAPPRHLVADTRPHVYDKNPKDRCVIVLGDSDSDSDSDWFSSRDFRSLHPRDCRLPYRVHEDEEILKFVLTGDNIKRTTSISLWKKLESLGTVPSRTYQSLKNRFLRNLKPHLLTRYKHMMNTDTIKAIIKKYPELKMSRGCHPSGSKKYPELSVNSQEHSERLQSCNEEVRTAQTEMCEQRLEPNAIPSTSRTAEFVNISAEEKLTNAPVQRFEYKKTIGPFSEEANLNLNLRLSRAGKDQKAYPNGLSVNITVIVTTGKLGQKRRRRKRNVRHKRRVRKKRCGLKKSYVLTIKNNKRFRRSLPWYGKAVTSMLQNIADEKKQMQASADVHGSQASMVVPSYSSETTNCSTECESLYSQTMRAVAQIYKLEVRPTPTLMEDDSEGCSSSHSHRHSK